MYKKPLFRKWMLKTSEKPDFLNLGVRTGKDTGIKSNSLIKFLNNREWNIFMSFLTYFTVAYYVLRHDRFSALGVFIHKGCVGFMLLEAFIRLYACKFNFKKYRVATIDFVCLAVQFGLNISHIFH